MEGGQWQKKTSSIPCKEGIYKLAFSPDGKYLAAAGDDYLVRIWKTPKGREIARIAHEGPVYDMTFSPDGGYLAMALGPTAGVWTVADGKKIAGITHEEDVYDLAFSPDGKYLATASADHTARLSLWQSQHMMDEACDRLRRNLTPKEWSLYLDDEPYCKTCPNLP